MAGSRQTQKTRHGHVFCVHCKCRWLCGGIVEGWAVVTWSGGGGHDVGGGSRGVWYVVMVAWCGVRWSWSQHVVVVAVCGGGSHSVGSRHVVAMVMW